MANEKPTWDATIELLAKKKALLEDTRRNIRAEIKARLEAEAAKMIADKEEEFAGALASAVEAGVPVTRIQRDVLRTRDWSAWKKWYDLANLDEVKATVEAEKRAAAERAKGYTFNPISRVLTVVKADAWKDREEYVLKSPLVVVLPDPWEGDKSLKVLPLPKDWYASGEAEGTYQQMMMTVKRIAESLGEEGS